MYIQMCILVGLLFFSAAMIVYMISTDEKIKSLIKTVIKAV
jgi:hypothetical protein